MHRMANALLVILLAYAVLLKPAVAQSREATLFRAAYCIGVFNAVRKTSGELYDLEWSAATALCELPVESRPENTNFASIDACRDSYLRENDAKREIRQKRYRDFVSISSRNLSNVLR